MRVHTGKAVVVGAAVVALGLAACSSGGGGSSKGSKGTASHGTLIYGESTDFPENLMPLIAAGNSTATANLEGRLINGPFRVTPKIAFEPDPDQVVGTPTSAVVGGQQVVTYKLNPKAIWDDGQPVTAKDYIFTAASQKSADPTKGGCKALLGTTGYDQIDKVEQGADAQTVKVTFLAGKSFPDWAALFSPLLSAHVMDKGSPKADCDYITKGWPTTAGFPAGTTNGPWVLQTKNIDVAKKTFTLTPNAKYWGSHAKLADLVYVNIGSDAGTNVTALQNQEVNMVYPQPQLDLIANLNKLSGVTTAVNFGVAFEHLDFNTKDPLLGHKEIRQAIALAIDRPSLVAATVGKFSDKASVLGNRLVMTNQTGYVDNGTDYAKQDVAKAKQLLESVGCTLKGAEYTCFGKPLAFKIETTQSNPLRDQTIATIASQVKAAGIKITEDASPDIFAGTDKPHSLVSEGFQIALFAWVGGPNISSNASIYQKGGGQNYTQASDPAADDQLVKMSTATNSQDETTAAVAADKQLWTDIFTLPLYQKPTLLAFDSNFTGIGDNATSAGPLWNSDSFQAK